MNVPQQSLAQHWPSRNSPDFWRLLKSILVSVLVHFCCCNEMPETGSFVIINSFPTVLDTRKSKIKASLGVVPGERLFLVDDTI